ncbi:Eco57I restriction-modification methylase domain-containing protein [Thermotalea metallivorans]|uniref:site-specific DNA-methyltransferase (adenine-specific) n=1 Tax=Thermotalea metallivorans TaxID=520762 RepID=A0A140L1B2_9FIRM|nr:TaqI-like C-terminal specificity domain-containing protein [Thermotalea metallivorans]KXG74337.1 Type IIS restriction enzyme Eco57I [Thermotalea metallivorans]
MENKKILKRFHELMKDIENFELNKEDAIVGVYMVLFGKKFGQASLKSAVKDMAQIPIQRNLVEEIAHRYEDLELIHMLAWYENYLSTSVREQTGSFYTPQYIIDFMVEKTLIMYLHRETGIQEEHLKLFIAGQLSFDKIQSKEILKALRAMKLIDIACGTGLFILRSFDKVYILIKRLYEKLGEEIEDFIIKKEIVENNLFAIDIQIQPVLLLRMALLSCVYGEDVRYYGAEIHFNGISADSLEDSWMHDYDAFQRILQQDGGFDIVIGNPPYLGEKGNKALFDRIKGTDFGAKYYEGKMDYFYFFIYRGIDLLKTGGILSFITTNYFVTADGAAKLRAYLKEHCTFKEIINFNDFEVFKSAKGQHNMIFFITKGKDMGTPVRIQYFQEKRLPESDVIEALMAGKGIENKISCYLLDNQERLYNGKGHMHIHASEDYLHILNKISKKASCTLGQLCHVNQGIVSGADRMTKDMLEKKISPEAAAKHDFAVNQGIFVLTEAETENLGLIGSPYLKPMYKNSDIRRYAVKDATDKYILYMAEANPQEENLNPIIHHLYKYKDILDQRRETLKGVRPWYALQWPRHQDIFEGEKIVVPHRAKENRFAFCKGPWYASADVYFITKKEEGIDLLFLLGQLNSKLMYFWLYNKGKRKGDDLELYANPLKELPILMHMEDEQKNQIIALVEKMICYGEDEKKQACLDALLYKLYDFTEKEIALMHSLYQKSLKK